jgi:endo-1,4-beta-xylanase
MRSIQYDRRRALGAAGSALTAVAALSLPGLGAAGPTPAAQPTPSLRDAAAAKGLLFGSDSDIDFASAPAEYRALFVAQCALYAPDLPWAGMSPKPGENDFSYGADSIAFATDHGMRLTGGHLLWHEALPKWFVHLSSREAAHAAATAHVEGLARRWAGKTYAWNVVNEALDPYDGRADGLRRTPLLAQLGPDFIAESFQIARSADPSALLVYNDYDLELDLPEHEARRSAMLGLVDRLLAAKAPIQGIGIQSHLARMQRDFDDSVFRKFLEEIAARGLKIIVTELDVNDIDLPGDIAARDRGVAESYARYLAVCLDQRAVIAVITWGLSDRYTWLTPESGANFRRRDRLPQRPLPFDADFRPKPAFDAVLKAIEDAPARG